MHPQTRIYCIVRTAHDDDADLALGGMGWVPINDLEGRPANTVHVSLYPCPELADQMAAHLAREGLKDLQVRRVWWQVDELSRKALEHWFESVYERKSTVKSHEATGS